MVRPADGSTEFAPRMAGPMMKAMTQRAEDLGVDIRLNTPVRSLIKENGRVVGVIAEDQNGEKIEARAKAVIIATGGAGDNPKMIKEYTGYEWGKDFFSFRVPGMDGDGLQHGLGSRRGQDRDRPGDDVPRARQPGLPTTSSSTGRSGSPACGSTPRASAS